MENLIHQIPDIAPFNEDSQLKNLAVHPKAGNCQRRRFQSYLQILYYSIYQTMLLVKLLQSLCPSMGRELVNTLDDSSNNCLFESVLCQISYRSYMFHPDDNSRLYSAYDLRLQAISYIAINYEEVFPAIKDYLNATLKKYLLNMIDCKTEGDSAMFLAVRRVTKVNEMIYIHIILLYCLQFHLDYTRFWLCTPIIWF